MDAIKKLFRKISSKDQSSILAITERLANGDKSVVLEKIKNTDFYRVRYKDYRIIFHRENGIAVIDSIKMRNDNTYKSKH